MKRSMVAADSQTGSFTVYFLMAFLPLLLLVLAFLMIIRARIERSDAERILHTAGSAVLGCYYEDLEEQYGLFGIGQEKLTPLTESFLRDNAAPSLAQVYQQPVYWLEAPEFWAGLFSYEMQSAEVTVVKSLGELEEFTKQVERFMQYRLVIEAVDVLEESLQMFQGVSGDNGLRARYADFSDLLMEYNSVYGKLIEDLYPQHGEKIYVTMTQKTEWAPSTLLSALSDLEDENAFTVDAMSILSRWSDIGDGLARKNADALTHLEKLEKLTVQIRSAQEAFATCADSLPDAEGTDQAITEMKQNVQESMNALWGMHGEIGDLRRTLTANQRAASELDAIGRLYRALTRNYEDTGAAMSAARYAASLFRSYDGTIRLSYTKGSGPGIDLDGLWKKVENWTIDLQSYGTNERTGGQAGDDLETQTGSYRQRLVEEMEKMEKSSRWIEDVWSRFLLAEYGKGVFTCLTDQTRSERGESVTNARGRAFPETYFRNEQEYLLCGHADEVQNLTDCQWQLLAIRQILNITYLLMDNDKKAVIVLLSESIGNIIAPGAGGKVMEAALTFLWAAAESYTDYITLARGGRIPLLKTSESWQTDLEELPAEPPTDGQSLLKDGLSYEDYLCLLSLLVREEDCVARMQTLIEKNMQLWGYEGFSMDQAAASFSVETRIVGKQTSCMVKEIFGFE